MANIDESKRKPRRTRGTPSYYYRNRFALAVISAGAAIFSIFTFTPVFKVSNEKFKNTFYKVSQEELERRALFSLLPRKTSDDILKIMKEEEKLRIER